MAKREKAKRPEVGERVKLRGRDSTGVLVTKKDNLWCRVEWDNTGPLICHYNELE